MQGDKNEDMYFFVLTPAGCLNRKRGGKKGFLVCPQELKYESYGGFWLCIVNCGEQETAFLSRGRREN